MDLINTQQKINKWLLLFLGSSGYLLSGPVFQIGVAGWIMPIGILFFMRSSSILKGYAWAVLFMSIFIFISGYFSSALPITATLVSSIISGILEGLPYLVTVIVYKRIKPKYSIFLLPVFAVTYEYLISFSLSSIGVLAATQTSFLPFIQMASITGVFGISFMMYLVAAVVVSLMFNEAHSKFYLKRVVIVGIAILIYGTIKIRSSSEVQQTVKTAGIALEENSLYQELYSDFFNQDVKFTIGAGGSPELDRLFRELEQFQRKPNDLKYKNAFESLKNFEKELLKITLDEARNGAKIIAWSETNLAIFKKDEDKLIKQVAEIAQEYDTTILVSMAVLLPYVEGGPMYENKSVLISPSGDISDSYEKSYPVPFLDSSLPGDGILDIVETPYGKLTTAICYDGDFPELISQSGKADILLLPSNDWLGISPFHGDNAIFRAIENGVSIIRPTGSGQSIVFDPHGKIIAKQDAYDKRVRVINAHVPVSGVTTIFNYIGNSFPKICILIAVILIGIIFIRPVRKRTNLVHE